MEIFENKEKNIRIVAKSLNIGNKVSFGNNISISVKGEFCIGDFSRLGNNVSIRGNNVKFGKHLFHSQGLQIGGGGRQHPDANFEIGDRCTIHNNFINICEPVIIGNDVGLSQDVAIITHGYWLSVLEGYPASFAGVKIGDGVIIGYRTVILMGVNIEKNCVIGANSTVTKSLLRTGIYVGSPVKFIKEISVLSLPQKIQKTKEIIEYYMKMARYHDLNPDIEISYPKVRVDDFVVNFETMEYSGKETNVTDDFRDYIRKWGIRIYTERPFESNFKFD
jgi:acetyltransferase-like isoleucine patch superfamily enzyme